MSGWYLGKNQKSFSNPISEPSKILNLIHNSTVAYIIWYGTWTSTAKNIIQNFVSGIGGTPWWAINGPYGGVGKVVLGGTASDNYSQGKSLTDQAVWNVVVNAVNSGYLPANTNGIYLVITSRWHLALRTFQIFIDMNVSATMCDIFPDIAGIWSGRSFQPSSYNFHIEYALNA